MSFWWNFFLILVWCLVCEGEKYPCLECTTFFFWVVQCCWIPFGSVVGVGGFVGKGRGGAGSVDVDGGGDDDGFFG